MPPPPPCPQHREDRILWACRSHIGALPWASITAVRGQNPVRLDNYSEPEPDIALVTPRDDLTLDRVETHREPRGDAYAAQQIPGRDADITPLHLPDVTIRVADLFA